MTARYLGRCADVWLLQPTNYWKNAQQNGMPFSLNPSIIYRGACSGLQTSGPRAALPTLPAAAPGIVANTLNNGFCVMSQFFINGQLKKLIVGAPTAVPLASLLTAESSGMSTLRPLPTGTGGENRDLTNTEKIACGVGSGALSGVVRHRTPHSFPIWPLRTGPCRRRRCAGRSSW